ncbi:hypothetical protein LY15_003149 [Prauserella flava]|nr:hypothetical protein [Prauserella flava]MCR3734758.1 hypothetical protein [Prauserella salsuginis]
MNPRQSLHLVGTIELATLVALPLNMATVHLPALLHGLAYTVTVIVAVLLMNGRNGRRCGDRVIIRCITRRPCRGSPLPWRP